MTIRTGVESRRIAPEQAAGEPDVLRLMNAGYGATSLLECDGPPQIRLRRIGLGRARLDRLRMSFTGCVAGGPWPRLHIAELHAGRVDLRTAEGWRTHRGGEFFVLARPGEQFVARIEEPDLDLVIIDPDVLTEVAGAANGLQVFGDEPVCPAAAANWSHVCSYVRECAGDPELTQHQLLVGALERLLAAVTLASFPNGSGESAIAVDGHRSPPETLRRAVEFIEANPHRSLTVAEIAGAAHVGTRAIQLAFRRHLDTTPTAFVREARLAAAHRDLREADPDRVTVATIAHRWGFTNTGRFAAAHRSSYGCSPAETLHTPDHT